MEAPKIDGIQFMPIRADKRPIHTDWQHTKRDYSYLNAEGVGLVCGGISGQVECIDIDTKYDLTGTLYERFKLAIKNADKTILPNLTVQQTKSGGYHFIYRCTKLEGNKKLAQRHTTQEEKEKTYHKTLAAELAKINAEAPNKEELEAKAQTIAKKAMENDKVRVLLETRGDGGFIACYPTDGYTMVHGSFENIKFITPEQRDTIFFIAREFNEYFQEFQPPKEKKERQSQTGLSPFEDYNERGDIFGLLESNGWSKVGQKGRKTLFKRPGETSATHSGNFDAERNWFSVFSTSTPFDPEKAYLPYAVFAILECDGDFSEAAKVLYEDGYGERREERTKSASSIEIPSRINLKDNDFSFIASAKHYMNYLTSLRNGTFVMGLGSGLKSLDKHFLFKEGYLVIINGHDNVGKSTVLWFLFMLFAMYHDLRWIVYSSENTVGGFYRKMIEFYWCEAIVGMPEEKYQEALNFVNEHFTVIVSDEALYNYKDILNMAQKIIDKKPHHGLLIDPYNSLTMDLSPTSKKNSHDYHYDALSEIKLFAAQKNISAYINCHAVTGALRMKDSDGFPAAPLKADTEHGGKFANKAADFLTIHRKVQHPDDWMVAEIHVRKIKETETGGKVTPFEQPVLLRMTSNFCGFEETDSLGVSRNPVHEWHYKRNNQPAPPPKKTNENPHHEINKLPRSEFDIPETREPIF